MSSTTGMKRLYKSRSQRMIDGVCGGIAQYFDLDPTLVRIAWVLLTLLGGSGIILYIAGMIIIPKEPFPGSLSGESSPPDQDSSSRKNSFFWGLMLIGVGLFLFFDNIGWAFWRPWWWLHGDVLLPVLLILAGVAFLWGGRNSLTATSPEGQKPEAQSGKARAQGPEQSKPRPLYRSFTERKLFGVCGGLGEYFELDPALVRILFLIATIASGGGGILVYIILAIVIPRETPTFKTP